VTRVLLLAYHFPPIGGGGTQRALKLARYLPEFGYDVTVLTGPGDATERWTPRDSTLLAGLSGVEIRRLAGPEPDPAWSGGWPSRFERWFGVQSPWTRWWIDGATAEGLRVGADADVILATMSPYSSADVAVRLGRALDRPWVADLRDPWALDEMMLYPTALHRRREVLRMKKLLRAASAVIANTPEAATRIRGLVPGSPQVPVVAVPNGFDGADFAVSSLRRGDGVFRIVHTGYLHTELGCQQRRARLRRLLGGEVRGVDIMTRSHLYLLEAIERVVAHNPTARIELVLAGVLSDRDRDVATHSRLVRLVGYQTHEAAIALMRSADLLFLPMQNLPEGMRATIVPGKTYEYLAAQRPILAAVPEGDARDLLLDAGTAHLCAPDDVTAMAAAIEAQLGGTGALRARPPRDLLARIERRALAGEVAALLDFVTDRNGDGDSRTYPFASPLGSAGSRPLTWAQRLASVRFETPSFR
jgi:glycosyltransferase involved in cell wall biosynthesis